MTISRVPVQTPQPRQRTLLDVGGWVLFFVIVYVILLFKVVSADSISNHVFFGLYSVIITSYIFSRFIFSYFHRPFRIDRRYEPSISFVVPAKDEEDNIAKTIRRFAEVEYPGDKIEVIAIDDGSEDHTYERMLEVAGEIEPKVGRVEVVQFDRNRGKRYGMAEGAKRARNDIVIFIDSDSFVAQDSVRHLVK
jgi:hyaluronan synthase